MSLVFFHPRQPHPYRASGQQQTVRHPTVDSISAAATTGWVVACRNHTRDTGLPVPAGAWVLVLVTLFTPDTGLVA